MEVFIRDEDKPKNCFNCLCHDGETGQCNLNDNYTRKPNKRPHYCPLKSLDQHDAEVRNKVIDELLEWADSKIMDWINSPNYREPHFRGTRIIHYCDLEQKLNELKGE